MSYYPQFRYYMPMSLNWNKTSSLRLKLLGLNTTLVQVMIVTNQWHTAIIITIIIIYYYYYNNYY